MIQFEGQIKKNVRDGRLIGFETGSEAGPTVLFFGGIHGNEPAGVKALESVFAAFKSKALRLRKGTLVGIRGNLGALSKGNRYLVRDLNRLWTIEQIKHIKTKGHLDLSAEEEELLELFNLLDEILYLGTPPFYFIDLHTTSSRTLPFITINDALINRKFSMQFPVPVILGIEEYLEGPLLSYINQLGYVSLGFESGQHQELPAVRNSISFIWLSLVYMGLLDSKDVDLENHFNRLYNASEGNHNFFEVIHRHVLKNDSDFKMVEGFKSFQSVRKGTILAIEDHLPIELEDTAILFMPLYQKQGDEGFFLIRRIPPWALKLSAILRRLKFHSLLIMLPGISWAKPDRDQLQVNLKIARFLSKPLFHLLGYRLKYTDRTHMVLSNRERTARNEDYRKTKWFRARG